MSEVKVVFFDTKDFEKQHLLEHKLPQCNYVFIDEPFHDYVESNKEHVEDADVVTVFTTSKITAHDLSKFVNLKMLATRSTGFNNIDLEYCTANNIPVVNVPKYGDITVAEFAFGLLLNVIRKINQAYEKLRAGGVDIKGTIGHDLYGKTIGLIGTGAIGQHAAKIAKGFGMNVIAYDLFPKKELESSIGLKYVDTDELFRTSDVISIHCPATKETHHLVDGKAFAKMKKGVVIINTARGEVVDTSALYKALTDGIVSGAGLDVLECENIIMNGEKYLMKVDCIDKACLERTLINNKLVGMPNVIVTPHVAFDTYEAVERILNTTIDNIQAFLDGKIINRVN